MTLILIKDDLHPESEAMVQALYSRSPASVIEHLKKVEQVGADKFMGQYYVGYGHDSIGDCGTTTIFVEGVSMLAAKAIQDWPLYRGQEASTRYMDFSESMPANPIESKEGELIQATWMDFYRRAEPRVVEHLRSLYPISEGEDEKVYGRAIKARSFDILRAFLPAGVTTNLSWHTDLRQAADHLAWMRRHPDLEIADLADAIYDKLAQTYPSSFGRKVSDEVSAWMNQVSEYYTYDVEPAPKNVQLTFSGFGYTPNGVLEMLKDRPKRAPLPHWLGQYGSIESRFELDFGSFRDLQRHRNGVMRMPLLSPSRGFHPWYLEQLPEEMRDAAVALIATQIRRIQSLDASPEQRQYYCAMGFLVSCHVTQPLPAFLYRIELRTSPSVHPTLRRIAQQEATIFMQRNPGIACHADMSPDTWDTRRGKQTIEEKA